MEEITKEIGWLKSLYKGLESLDEMDFAYDQFITEIDPETKCGTVCCAFGWMPKFVPESGLEWKYEDKFTRLNRSPMGLFKSISAIESANDLTVYCVFDTTRTFRIGQVLIEFIFEGRTIDNTIANELIDVYDSYHNNSTKSSRDIFGHAYEVDLGQAMTRILAITLFLEKAVAENNIKINTNFLYGKV